MRFQLLLVVVVASSCSAVVIDKSIGDGFSSSSSNALPASSGSQHLASQYGPPPPSSPSSGGLSLQYGPPPPPPPSYSYGPPPQQSAPPAGNSYSLKPNKYKLYSNALSLFDGECGHWKALSMFLLLIGAATGVGLLFRAWPLYNFSVLGLDDETTSRLSDPAFLTSVYEQVADISRVLMNIKDANFDPKEE